MRIDEKIARTGLKFGYPDGYFRHQYPDAYCYPRSATAALDLEINKEAPMGEETPNGMPRLIKNPKNMQSFKEWLKSRASS